MTQAEKELLLRELCARLPYDVKVWVKTHHGQIIKSDFLTLCNGGGYYSTLSYEGILDDSIVMPYLRPMSSMTEEEKEEYDSFLFDNLEREDVIGYEDKAFGIDVIMRYRSWDVVQWLLEHHFDFNGLIDVHNLALEAPEGMYK